MVYSNFFVSNYKKHSAAYKDIQKYKPLRTLLSDILQSPKEITFRNNTTIAFIDLLEVLQHSSYNTITYSNLEHPTILTALDFFWKKNKRELDLYHFLLKGDFLSIEKELVRQSKDATPSIFIISEVLWNVGAKIFIGKVAKKIKKNNPKHLVIIDAAQSIGNIPPLSNSSYQSIDFYFGGIHKWLNIPNTLGFISINPNIELKIKTLLFLKDIFADFAGEMPHLLVNTNISTYNLLYLKQIIQKINTYKYTTYDKISYKNYTTLNKIHIPKQRKTNFFGLWGHKKDISLLLKKQEIEIFQIADDNNLSIQCENQWVRFQNTPLK